MVTKSLPLIILVFLGTILLSSVWAESCNRYCKNKFGKFDCCETPPPVPPPHPGRCPNPFCPENPDSAPLFCHRDFDCPSRHYKCCFSACQPKKVCVKSVPIA